jgi:hypothetical protein
MTIKHIDDSIPAGNAATSNFSNTADAIDTTSSPNTTNTSQTSTASAPSAASSTSTATSTGTVQDDTAASPTWVLVPEPVLVQASGAMVALPTYGRIRESLQVDDHGFLARQIADDIEQLTGLVWNVAVGENWSANITLGIDASLPAQAYRLDIGDTAGDVIANRSAQSGQVTQPTQSGQPDQPGQPTQPTQHAATPSPLVSIVAGSLEGVRYGAQTLRQLLRQTAPALPVVHIEDEPAYQVRGYYLDVTRGRVPTLAWLKAWAERLALMKYNQLQLYIEHSFAFDALSEAWRGTDPLTPGQMMEFDEYCHRLGIELVPSVSTFGHHYMALRTHSLRSLGEFPEDAERPYSFIERQNHHTLNITDPGAFEFSRTLIDQYMGLFRSRKFNIGADETFDLGRGRSHEEAQRTGTAQMYAHYVDRLCAHLRECGREPMLWADVAIEMPEILDELPQDAIVLNWLYAPQVDSEKVALVARSGATQYVCPAVWCWNALVPRLEDAWNNISRLARYGMEQHAAGFLVTDWGDFGHVNDPRMSTMGMMYAAECAWRGTRGSEQTQFDEVRRRVDTLLFSDDKGHVSDALIRAHDACTFDWMDMVRYLELGEPDGTVNDDVLHTIDGLDRAENASQQRKAYLRLHLDEIRRTPQSECEYADIAVDLASALGTGGSTGRLGASALKGGGFGGDGYGMTAPMMIAVEGQRLFNQVGWHLAVAAGLISEPASEPTSDSTGGDAVIGDDGAYPPSAPATAAALELWFEAYTHTWMEVSAHSELERVASVIWRCCDMLRQYTESTPISRRGSIVEA